MMRGTVIAAPPLCSHDSQKEPRDMYTIVHHYLTLGDDDQPVVEVEARDGIASEDLTDAIRRMVEHPGGRSGTTISLNVALTKAVTI